MGIIEKDGFKFHDGLLSGTIIVEDKKLNDYISYINKKEIKNVSIVEVIAYKSDNLSFLTQCSNVETVRIVGSVIKDYSGLYALSKLQKLHITDLKGKVDLSRLPNLIELTTQWNKYLIALDSCKKLKKLGLNNYNPSNTNCESLSELKSLKELIIIKSNINSFKGLGLLRNLEKIDLSYLNNLERIDELALLADSIKHLRFDSCKKIQNHDYVTQLKELELLAFDYCGEIKSIKFIKKLPKLKKFIFVGTNVLDGDLTPCIGLDYVGFLNKKHYSHKVEDFKK